MEALVYENPTITVDGKTYKVQRLGLKHMVQFIKILKGAKIVNQFSDMIRDIQAAVPAGEGEAAEQDEAAEQEVKQRAIGVAINLLFSLVEADAEIYQLVAAVTGMDAEEAANLPLDVTVELIEILYDAPDIKTFIKAVQMFLGRKVRPMAAVPAN